MPLLCQAVEQPGILLLEGFKIGLRIEQFLGKEIPFTVKMLAVNSVHFSPLTSFRRTLHVEILRPRSRGKLVRVLGSRGTDQNSVTSRKFYFLLAWPFTGSIATR